MSGKKERTFKTSERKYRCEKCMGDVREEQVFQSTNPHWFPRCPTCNNPMTQLDSKGKFLRPKEPKPKPRPPEMPGQISLI